MKIISFSLFGAHSRYCNGAIVNIEMAKEFYPDWKCRFYVDNSVPPHVINKIKEMGQEIVIMPEPDVKAVDNTYGHVWRYLPVDDPNVDVMISRDCDSRFNHRELAAVNEWLKSDKCFHTMHDHPLHIDYPILAGMWGAKKGCVPVSMSDKIMQWTVSHNKVGYLKKGDCQRFLRDEIWPIIKNKCLRHGFIKSDMFGDFVSFPDHLPLKSGAFVASWIA